MVPGERPGRRQHHAHHQPSPRSGVAEGVDPSLTRRPGIDRSPASTTPDVPRTTDSGPGPVMPAPTAAAAWSPAPAATGTPSSAPTASGLSASSGSHDAGISRSVEQLAAPTPFADVEEQRSRRIGDVAAMSADEAVAHEVLGETDAADARECGRLVLAHPEQLRRGEPGQGAVSGQPEQTLSSRPGFQGGALRCGSLIVPEDRRADHRTFGVEADEPVHLTREADAEDLRRPGPADPRSPPAPR